MSDIARRMIFSPAGMASGRPTSNPLPTSPPPRTSFLPSFSQDLPASSSTANGSSPFKEVAEYLPRRSLDPLANFRADAVDSPIPPLRSTVKVSESEVRREVEEVEDEIPGIEDISMSQLDREVLHDVQPRSGPDTGDRSRSSRSRFSRTYRFDEADVGLGGSVENEEEAEVAVLPVPDPGSVSRSVSDTGTDHPDMPTSSSSLPSPDRNLGRSSLISQGAPGEDLDEYDQSMIDDDIIPSSPNLYSSSPTLDRERKRKREWTGLVLDGKSDDDEATKYAGSSSARRAHVSSTPIPTSLVTPHESSDQEGEDEGAVHWTPSPMSPRALARREGMFSMAAISREKGKGKERMIEPEPIVLDSDRSGSESEKDGDSESDSESESENDFPAASTSRSARSRSTARRAAVTARARVRNAVVLSDDEDGDYDPFVGGEDEAFGREYERQARLEENEPEETDGSEDDDDGEDEVGEGQIERRLPKSRQRRNEVPDSDDDAVVMLATQRVSRSPRNISQKSQNDWDRNNQAGSEPGPSRFPQSSSALAIDEQQEDEYDDLPMDGLDTLDLDELTSTDPTRSSAAAQGPRLTDLFSPDPPKRVQPTIPIPTSRTPLSELNIPNVPYISAAYSKCGRLLQQLDDVHGSRPRMTASNVVAVGHDIVNSRTSTNSSTNTSNRTGILDAIDDTEYMPVSQMPAKWKEFYRNHWRRGADKARIPEPYEDDEDEEESDTGQTGGTRGGTAMRGRGGKAGRGGAAARGKRATRGSPAKKRATGVGGAPPPRQRIIQDEEEDFDGDLGGPSGPSGNGGGPSGWGKKGGKGWFGKKNWAKKGGVRKKK